MNWQTQHSSDGNTPNLRKDLMQLKECGNATKILPPGQDFKEIKRFTKNVFRTDSGHDTYFQKIEIYGRPLDLFY